MASKKFPKQFAFWMNTNDYDVLQKFLLEEERPMASFLRLAIRKELNSDFVPDINQILTLGYKDIKDHKQVNFKICDNDSHALNEYLKNTGLGKATFFRYLTKKELIRLETYNKEKTQTWDLD